MDTLGRKPLVLSLTTMHSAGMDRLRSFTELRMASSLDPEVLQREIADREGLVIRTAGVIDAALMDAAPKLRVIGRHGVGVDQIDIPAATSRGIQIVSTPGANTEAVCEHAFALMIGVSKHFTRMIRTVQEYRHDDRTKFMGRDIFRRSLGIIGFGRIGRRVGEVAHGAFQMKVVYNDIVAAPPEIEAKAGATRVDLDTLLSTCEYVTLHVPLDDSTRYLMNAETIRKMRPDAILINTCRGAVVEEADVARALDEKRLWGYGADVYAVEPPLPGHPLIGRDDVLLTPHSAAQTVESLINMAEGVVDDVLGVLAGKAPLNPVNDPAIVRENARRLGKSAAVSD